MDGCVSSQRQCGEKRQKWLHERGSLTALVAEGLAIKGGAAADDDNGK